MLFTTMTAMLWAAIASFGLPRREQGCRTNAGKPAEGASPAWEDVEGSQCPAVGAGGGSVREV